jgi:hypothetical protein
LYPSLVPPPDEGLDDGDADARDGVYQHGLTIAEDIREQTAAEGRRKRPVSMVRQTPRQPDQPSRSVCGGVTRRGVVRDAVVDGGGLLRGQRRRLGHVQSDRSESRHKSSRVSPSSDLTDICRSACSVLSQALLFKLPNQFCV